MSFKYSKPPAKKIVKVARQCIKLNKHRPTRSNTNQTLCEGTGNLTERVIFKDNKVRQSRSFEVNEIRQEIRRFKRINVEMNKRRIATSRGPETSRGAETSREPETDRGDITNRGAETSRDPVREKENREPVQPRQPRPDEICIRRGRSHSKRQVSTPIRGLIKPKYVELNGILMPRNKFYDNFEKRMNGLDDFHNWVQKKYSCVR